MREVPWKALVVVTATLVATAIGGTLFAEAPADPTPGVGLLLAVLAVALVVFVLSPQMETAKRVGRIRPS